MELPDAPSMLTETAEMADKEGDPFVGKLRA